MSNTSFNFVGCRK